MRLHELEHPVIDTDVHCELTGPEELFPYLSEYWVNMVKATGLPIGRPQYLSPIGVVRADARTPDDGPPASDPAYLIEHHLDALGIDYAVLGGAAILGVSVFADADFANAATRAFNDHLAARWLSASPRFLGSILVNHSDPLAAVEEIARHAGDPRFVQVLMGSGSRELFGKRHFYPIYEAAEHHGLPVAFHPGSEGAGVAGYSTPSGPPSRYFEWHTTLPANYMAHLTSLVTEGVFERFPRLRIVAQEGGFGWLPHLMWRMDKNYKALRWTTPYLKRLPSEYILEHVRLTTQPIEEPPHAPHLLQIFEMMHADRTLMFSSDYPHWDNDDPNHALPRMPADLARRILFANAAEIFRGDFVRQISTGAEEEEEVGAPTRELAHV